MNAQNYKSEILKQEIDMVFQKIKHFDDLRNRTKQLAITLWVAALGASLSFKLRPLLILSAIVPIPFWYFEATYHAYQEGFSSRLSAIEYFLRTGRWRKSRRAKGEIIEPSEENPFPIPDYYGDQTLNKNEHDRETSVLRNAFKFKTIIFYPLLGIISLVLFFFYKNILN